MIRRAAGMNTSILADAGRKGRIGGPGTNGFGGR
jgi:hypothetical protein